MEGGNNRRVDIKESPWKGGHHRMVENHGVTMGGWTPTGGWKPWRYHRRVETMETSNSGYRSEHKL